MDGENLGFRSCKCFPSDAFSPNDRRHVESGEDSSF